MACNGFNHPKDCKCNFRGGHQTQNLLLGVGGSPEPLEDIHLDRTPDVQNAILVCTMFQDLKVAAHITTHSDRRGPNTLAQTSQGPIRLSAARVTQSLEIANPNSSDGWAPFFVRNIERLATGTIIHGVSLDDPTVLHFGSLNFDLSLDKERPIYFRYNDASRTAVQLNFFPLSGELPIFETAFNDCRNDFDLVLFKKKR